MGTNVQRLGLFDYVDKCGVVEPLSATVANWLDQFLPRSSDGFGLRTNSEGWGRKLQDCQQRIEPEFRYYLVFTMEMRLLNHRADSTGVIGADEIVSMPLRLKKQ